MRRNIDLRAAIEAAADKPEADMTLTFDQLIARWLDATRGEDYRLRKWLSAFHGRNAWSITPDELRAAVKSMAASGYAPGSINRDIGAIGSAYRWISERNEAPAGFVSPTLSVRRGVEEARVVEVDPEVVARLRELSLSFGNPAFAVFVHLLLDTGARKSELLERRWADCDLDRRRIYLRASDTKTGKARALFFSEGTAALIADRCPARDPDALIFPGRCNTEPVNFRSSWARLTRLAGVPDLHLHDARHNRARELLVANISAAQTAAILGHSVQVLERRYGHLAVADKQAAAELTWA